METYDLIVIGGGASGMMAAGTAARRNPAARVLLIEKNRDLGAKLSITGGGRCNVTNDTRDVRQMLANYGDSARFLHSAFDQFSVADTFDFFEKTLNLPLTVQDRNRAFPRSERAGDVVAAMKRHCAVPNLSVLTGAAVTAISGKATGGTISSIETGQGKTYAARSFVLATGGLSHPETGSTGDGLDWLSKLGHTVRKPTPTLVPWRVQDAWIRDNAGNAVDGVKLTVQVDGKKYFSLEGRILCTHKGFSGPVILNHSARLQDALQSGTVTAFLDLYPKLNHKEVDGHVLAVFEANRNRKLRNVLSDVFRLPSAEGILTERLPYDLDAQVNAVSKEFRKSLVQLLKALPVRIAGLEGYDKAVVADGGIPLEEIDTKTMRSRRIENLYVTGDLLDIRRPSGGFSLQLCWTTGHVAGTHAAASLEPGSASN